MVSTVFSVLQSDETEQAKKALAKDLPALRALIGIIQEELCQTYFVIETQKKQMSQSVFIALLLYFHYNERQK